MFLSCHLLEDKHSEDIWLLESGCSNHMTGNKNLLSSLDASITSEIMLGDRTSIKAEGKGIVPILTKQNQNKYISYVYYVPQLKHNLISVGQLMEHGYDVLFQKNTCYIYDKDPHKILIAKVEKTKSRMFPLSLRSQNTRNSLVHNISGIHEITSKK